MTTAIPRWNDGITRWNDGTRWPAASPPQPEIKKMAEVVLNMRKLSNAGVINRARELKAGMAGNPNLPTPDPTVEAFDALITAGEAWITNASLSQEKSKLDTASKDDAIAAIVAAANQWGDQVQAASKGDPAIISTFNMGVKAAATHLGKLHQVEALSLTTGDSAGEVDGHWNAVHGAHNYEYQLCTGDPTVEANWQMGGSSSPSKVTIRNLTSGTRIYVRVRAKAPKDENDGPWSQWATIIVP